jgi:hypothetical protein
MGDVAAFPGVERPDCPAGQQPIADIVRELRALLAAAERGEIRGVAIAAINADTSTTQHWIAGDARHRLLASVCYLQHRMVVDAVDGPDAVDWGGAPA